MGKLKLDFDGMDKVINRLSKLEKDIKPVTEKALRESHKIVTEKAAESVLRSNLPAHGKFSHGDTARSLRKDAEILWNGSQATVHVGFDISNGGLPSIFMMYGTPRYMKNQKMYNAFYSKRTLDEIKELQARIFYEELRKFDWWIRHLKGGFFFNGN